MQLDRRLQACLCCAVLLVTPQAKAQPAPSPPPAPLAPPAPSPSPPPAATEPAAGSETLETPYNDAPPPARPPPASPSAPTSAARVEPPLAPADKRPLGPIRARRKLALTGELGWNGLAGFGPVLTYHFHPHVSADLGAGLSVLGWKAGLRGRYNFLTQPFTPFVGLGFNATSGLGEVTSDPKDNPEGDPDREPFTIDVKATYLVQAVVGFDFIHKRGFTLVGCLGYARVLNRNNFRVLAGTPTADERQAFDVFFKSGPVISVATGYAWE
jgi:hypothetical protein